jgi:hypothetical protein
VPFPDWDLYQRNPLAVPTCADGGTGGELSSRAPNVTLIIARPVAAVVAARFDLGYRTQLPLQLNGNFRYTYSAAWGLWGYRDLNLDESRRFTLGGENRPFFGDPSGIVERTGATSLASSRLHDEFGNVYEVVSDRESEAHQVTASGQRLAAHPLMFNVNYTLGFARDQGSGSASSAVPDGRQPERRRVGDVVSNDRRHTMNLMLSYPITPWMEISGMTRCRRARRSRRWSTATSTATACATTARSSSTRRATSPTRRSPTA